MIIIKIVILHFIQITHADDFPTTATWLVSVIVVHSVYYTTKYALQHLNGRPFMARHYVYRGRVIKELSSVLTPSAMCQHFSLDCLHSENF